MSETARRPARVGVRELRQNLSVYLRRVEQGEVFEVTERGKTVAQLGAPPGREESALDRLIAQGRATPARRGFSGLQPALRLPADRGPSLSQTLLAMREEDGR